MWRSCNLADATDRTTDRRRRPNLSGSGSLPASRGSEELSESRPLGCSSLREFFYHLLKNKRLSLTQVSAHLVFVEHDTFLPFFSLTLLALPESRGRKKSHHDLTCLHSPSIPKDLTSPAATQMPPSRPYSQTAETD